MPLYKLEEHEGRCVYLHEDWSVPTSLPTCNQSAIACLIKTVMSRSLLQAPLRLCCLLQGMSLGIGLAGTVVSAISFLTCWLRPLGPSHVKTVDEAAPEALAYFLLSSIIVAAAIVTYYVFFRHPFVKRHLQPQGTTHCTHPSCCCNQPGHT